MICLHCTLIRIRNNLYHIVVHGTIDCRERCPSSIAQGFATIRFYLCRDGRLEFPSPLFRRSRRNRGVITHRKSPSLSLGALSNLRRHVARRIRCIRFRNFPCVGIGSNVIVVGIEAHPNIVIHDWIVQVFFRTLLTPLPLLTLCPT